MNHLITLFNNTMKTKKYWQAADADGREFLYRDEKPKLCNGSYRNPGQYTKAIFPISLKPLQIAEITVCDDGTWSYEIEREEGWYMAVGNNSGMDYLVLYKDGEYRRYLRGAFGKAGNVVDIREYTISPTRIPDECII